MHGGWLHVVCGDSAAMSLRASGDPDVRTGLARWDEELLRHAPGTPVELVGRALRANEAWLDPVGDLVLFGEDVLAGRKNFVDHNGIDTWVAGVHLDAAAGRVWFRQGADLVRAGG